MAYTVLLIYACLSFAFFIWVRRRPSQSGMAPIVQVLDFLAVVLISIFTQGPESLVSGCFAFVVLAAANRCGLLETFVTCAALISGVLIAGCRGTGTAR